MIVKPNRLWSDEQRNIIIDSHIASGRCRVSSFFRKFNILHTYMNILRRLLSSHCQAVRNMCAPIWISNLRILKNNRKLRKKAFTSYTNTLPWLSRPSNRILKISRSKFKHSKIIMQNIMRQFSVVKIDHEVNELIVVHIAAMLRSSNRAYSCRCTNNVFLRKLSNN